MAKTHGRLGEFHLGDSGATLRDLTSLVSQVDMPRTVETAPVTALGDADHEYVIGVKGGTIRLQGFPTITANELDHVVDGILGGVGGTGPSAWKWFPQGSAASNVVYSGSCYVTSYSPGGGVAGAVAASVDLQITGAVTRATV